MLNIPRIGTEVIIKLVGVSIAILRSILHASTTREATLVSLSCKLVLGRTELTSSGSLLLEVLLLLSVGIADLDDMVLAVDLDGLVVEGSDDFFAGVAGLEAVGNNGQ